MKKLAKKVNLTNESIESYQCWCSCRCTCNPSDPDNKDRDFNNNYYDVYFGPGPMPY